MALEQYAYLAEIIGMAIVVVTLIVLAVQMRQNTRAIQGSTLHSIAQTQQSELRWSSDISDVWTRAIESPSELNSSEAWKMSEWLMGAMAARQNEFFQFDRGHTDRDEWEASERIILVILSLPWARSWWKTLGEKSFHANFVNLVNELYDGSEGLLDWESVLLKLKSVDP